MKNFLTRPGCTHRLNLMDRSLGFVHDEHDDDDGADDDVNCDDDWY